ncbi:formate hydrogenlyase subunit 3/multisubunit Na+/H+ antiporter, MnhD subunit [Rivularia sp. PCC 7116]|uniref:cation:proton antiporter n=1 Tax=Rivularia sp. PCC 7116 TaxID=373994 RepID=UPI00029EEAD5|nr:cation:proton antiporter [Rivularia sp. PCC 7116]AFY57660.1 formate hydrogenlyase subunit 3/multisubunit Na+/H+ antiporter, MnhD subunit [Rivularia sp. PCC 7116]
MNTITIVWATLPFFLGFTIYLIPKLDRYLALLGTFASFVYALILFIQQSPLTLELLDSFGVTLSVDELSAYFILTNALVSAAVILYCWRSDKSAFFYTQAIVVHGSVNAAFACTDFISLYVALEVSGIAAFLLIAYPRTDRSIWVALRYLFISNTAMLFYLIGAVLVYQANNSFAYAGLSKAPPEALALIFVGLLVKGGVFVSGLWLPLTHSESDTPVSALLSGVVVKAGVYPLIRCALIVEEIDPIVRSFGVATAFLGVIYALFENDTKRILASSTISQLGWILAAPLQGGYYALAHGLAKAALFLTAGNLPSRNIKQLQWQPIDTPTWVVLVIASLSISGMPLLTGYSAKVLTMKNLLSWQEIAMNIAVVGTVTVYARFIFLLRGEGQKPKPGFWAAIVLLLGWLITANVLYPQAYSLESILKAVVTIAVGWLLYWLIFKSTSLKLPRVLEEFEHLIGVMSLVTVVLFWMAFSWLGISY